MNFHQYFSDPITSTRTWLGTSFLYKITPNYNSNHENAKLPLTTYAKVLNKS